MNDHTHAAAYYTNMARQSGVKKIADRVVRDVAELGDCTSPPDWPEAMLVTSEELHSIVQNALLAETAEPDTKVEYTAEKDALLRKLAMWATCEAPAWIVSNSIGSLIDAAFPGAADAEG